MTTGDQSPTLSIVVPSHNRGRLLLNTLASLARQDHDATDFEVMVVDDGSTDGTGDMVRSFCGPFPLRYLRKPNHNCRAEARNVGIAAARGEYLLFLDAEMLCPPGFVRAHLDLHRRFGPCVVCGWHCRLKAPLPVPLPEDWGELAEAQHPDTGCIPGRNTAEYLLPLVSANASCRRVDALEVGLFDQAFVGYGHEDLDLGMRLYLLGRRFISGRSTMTYHQWHPPSARMELDLERNSRYYYRKHHRRRHVVHLLKHMVPGGIERFVHSLSRHLHGAQHLFTVVASHTPSHFADQLATLGAEVYHLGYGDLGAFLRGREVDLFHLHSVSPWIQQLRSLRHPAPAVMSLHASMRLPPDPLFRRICPVSHSLRRIQQGPPDLYRVVWGGTDPHAFRSLGLKQQAREQLGIPGDAFVAGTSMRPDGAKVSRRMMHVYMEMARLRPDLYVVLLGGGAALEEFRALVAGAGMADRVLLPGPVKDVGFHLEALDVCAHAVEDECFGLSVLEALAKGLPVVAPRIGGICETVLDGECGFLCRNAAELIQRVLGFADGTHDLAAMGQRARARSLFFDERRTALKYKLVYDEVIDGARYWWPLTDLPGRAACVSAQ